MMCPRPPPGRALRPQGCRPGRRAGHPIVTGDPARHFGHDGVDDPSMLVRRHRERLARSPQRAQPPDSGRDLIPDALPQGGLVEGEVRSERGNERRVDSSIMPGALDRDGSPILCRGRQSACGRRTCSLEGARGVGEAQRRLEPCETLRGGCGEHGLELGPLHARPRGVPPIGGIVRAAGIRLHFAPLHPPSTGGSPQAFRHPPGPAADSPAV